MNVYYSYYEVETYSILIKISFLLPIDNKHIVLKLKVQSWIIPNCNDADNIKYKTISIGTLF